MKDTSDNLVSASPLDGYRFLAQYHQWACDSYTRDFQFFLGVQTLLAGLTGKVFWDWEEGFVEQQGIALVLVLAGISICVVWISRQKRAYHLACSREKELRALEGKIDSEAFSYFGRVQIEGKDAAKGDTDFLSLLGIPVLPNVLRQRSFLHSLAVQKVFLYVWLIGLWTAIFGAG